MKNNKILIISLVVIIIGIIAAIVFAFLPNNNFDYKEIKEVRTCRGKGCIKDDPAYIFILKENTGIKELNDKIKEFNANTTRYLNKVQSSSTENDSSCSQEVKDKYYNSLFLENHVYRASDEKYKCIVVSNTIENVCTDEMEVMNPDVFIYSVASKKLLSQKEFKELEEITDEKIEEAIQKSLDYLGKYNDIDYDAKDATKKTLYYEDGHVKVLYYHPLLRRFDSGLIR